MYIEQVEDELFQLKKENGPVGTFKLIGLSNGVVKLEQLQVKDHISPGRILEVFEVILSHVEAAGHKELLVESHSDALDFLLQYQQFKKKDVEKRLWIYEVNHK
ncbi:hypothetical protein SAMN04487936_10829 [Halobacillus dabanensis]|uniref:N-acetyltransferase domain-containing protein n=1 Tax=Halobacillus dabanensis TaxID=240302 RepID=A0A1I3X650_HALDA|nr:hypothetical protein [Halobacillus dabanensis]SFK15135.1 hypothetical protein SAMN04487936_10829 [Halobacillus dabanensis]